MQKLLAFYISIFSFLLSDAQNNQPKNTINNGIERPKLVIGLVVDQMRWDYLYRYFDLYGNGGFKRLLQKGYSFDNTFIPFTPAVTATGHSCLYTGSVPAFHGIVGNDWLDKDTGLPMYCAQDNSVKTVGSWSAQGQMSPRNLLSTTIGDELRLATNFRSRVFGIAIKDRGGIFSAGHSANAAYWFDDSTGNWISSTYYMNELPKWVISYNSRKKADSLMRTDWNLLYNRSAYTQSTIDDKLFEKPLVNETNRTFPHSYKNIIGKNYLGFRASPYGNTFTMDFAAKLIDNENLGSMGQADMLCISLSSTDYIAHRFGPNSLEVEDTYLRLDKDIEKFLDYLDRKVGSNNYLLFMSADHGAPNIPDMMEENKLPGGSLHATKLSAEINDVLSVKYNADSLIKKIFEYQVYLDMNKIDSLHLNTTDIKKDIVRILLSRLEVVNAFDYENFDKVIMPERIKEMFAKGYYPKRSGEIQFILKPQYTDALNVGTEHGTWYMYDTHIPLLWYGWKIRRGKSNREVYMTDVAPTISALLHIQMPGASIGNVLPEIVQQSIQK